MRVTSLALFLAALACGQSFVGSLRGRMQDQSGGAVPTVKVEIIDEGTSTKRSTLTNELGEYTFASVTPATYTIAAEAPGFKRLEHAGVVVATQTAVTLDLTLELGAVSDQVNVTAEVSLLQTADASTGQVIDSQKLVDLPNLGRNPFMLSKLSEAVVQVGNPKFNRMQDQSGSSQISIAGGPVRSNNYTLDGISITDSTNRAVIIPSQEAVQEMKVQANTYDAEMGRTGGGTFNVFLRSGTNQLHGSAFGYLRQTDWVANNFFSNRAGLPRLEQPFRNYGGSFGGPVVIPKVYDGRNKTFFFATGEAYRQYDASGTRLSVPTGLERLGDFSQSLSTTRSGAQQIIYDPLTTSLTTGARLPFVGNVIPATQLSPIGVALASYYPLPNTATPFYGAPNYNASVTAFNRADQTTWKLDHQLFPWWRASASYLHYGSQEPSNRWFPNQIASPNQGVIYRKVDATQVNSTFTLSPTMVLTARYGFNRFPNFTPPISRGFDITQLGLSSTVANATIFPAFPSITMGDMQSFGGGNTTQNVYWSKSANVTISKFWGKHNLKAGFDWRLLHHDGTPGVGPSSFGFTDVFTRATPTKTTAGTGSSLATLLLGYPTSGSLTVATKLFDFVNYYGFFVQDDFRVSQKLTVNYGLRMEHETGPGESSNGYIVGFDGKAPSPLQATVADPKIFGTVLYAGVNGNPTTSMNPLGMKFGPRFGFAYTATPGTVIRGGYGVFWAPLSFSLQSTLGYSQSTPIVSSFNNNFTPVATLANPYPNGFLTPVGNSQGGLAGIGQGITVPDNSMRSAGYVQQFSLDVQRELPASFVLSTGFIGSKGVALQQDGRNINQLDPAYLSLGSSLNQSVANPMYGNGGVVAVGNPTIARSQLLLPYPEFTTLTLSPSGTNKSMYTSAYLKVQRRFANGLTALATYTWSRSMDQGYGTVGNTYSSAPAGPQNSYDLSSEYGLSSSSTPNRLSMAATYELPFGPGKSMLAKSKVLGTIAGGWSINMVSVIQSGYPLAITQPNNNSIFGASTQRPNATGISPDVNASFAQRLDGWINPAAFSLAPQFTFGNVSRVIGLRGPGQVNFDVSLFKTFQMGERFKAQFRAEALNFTNTPTFNGPNTTFTNGSFGFITTQANYPRLLQLGARLFF